MRQLDPLNPLDQIKADVLDDRKKVEEATAYLDSLKEAVFREVVVKAMIKLEAMAAGQPRLPRVDASESRPRRRNMIAMRYGKKARAKGGRKVVKMTLREAVTKVLANNASLATGAIVDAVKAIRPNSEYASIASEIKRMKDEGDGLIEERGRNDSGHALYALASAKEVSR